MSTRLDTARAISRRWTPSRSLTQGSVHRIAAAAGGPRARRGQRELPLARRILVKAMLDALPRAVGPGLCAEFFD